MAILTVENLGHSFGDRTLFKDVSFRLVEGDHIGLVGANASRNASRIERPAVKTVC